MTGLKEKIKRTEFWIYICVNEGNYFEYRRLDINETIEIFIFLL